MSDNAVVYFVQSVKGIKIGTSAQFKYRFATIRTKHPDLVLLGLLRGSYELEDEMHRKFAEHRHPAERGARATEWFFPSQAILDFITQNKISDDEAQPYINGTYSDVFRVSGVTLPADMYYALVDYSNKHGWTLEQAITHAVVQYYENRKAS